MSTTTNSEFAKRMMLLAQPAARFKPTATYDPDGDCIEFLATTGSFYAERVDDLVTVYFSQENGEVVGSLIKGVSAFCRDLLSKLPGFKIEIEAGNVRLQHIFLARLWSEKSVGEMETLTYRKLIEVADEAIVEGELCFS